MRILHRPATLRNYRANQEQRNCEMTEVAVVGAGLMGHALALVFALGGHRVRLTDSSPATLARAPGLMAQALDLLIEGGEAPEGWTRERLASVVIPCAGLKETTTGAELVIDGGWTAQ
jgi:3-hydroxybutyryl-CoA dehydrogenase